MDYDKSALRRGPSRGNPKDSVIPIKVLNHQGAEYHARLRFYGRWRMKKLKGAAKIAGIISMSLVMGCCSSGDLKGPSYTFPSPTPTTLIPTQTSASTSTPVPTIPPTFTPAPTATPTSTHEPVEWVPMSEEDQAAYDRALAEIEIYRKGDVSLIVVDANGDPMPGIKVSYKQTEGPIDWGVWQEPMYFHYVQELDIDLIAI